MSLPANGRRMNEKKSRGIWRPLLNMAAIAAVIVLAVTTYTRLSETARAVLVGAFCVLGVVVTVIMLWILVRQSNGKG